MKKIYKKFLEKLILLTYLLLVPLTSSAEIGDKKWRKECNESNGLLCAIAINTKISIPNSDEKRVLATAYIQMASKIKRKMNLVDEKKKTYELKENSELIPVLIINLPLNVNLKKNPLVQVDKKDILNIPYSHCNNKIGCVTSITINDEVIELFKAGKKMTVIISVYGNKQNESFDLSLKNFSKAYDSLIK